MRRKTSACLLAATLILLSACEKPDPDTCERKHGRSMMGRVGRGLGMLGGMAGGMGGGVGQGVGMGMRGLSTLAGLADDEGGSGGGPDGRMGGGMGGGLHGGSSGDDQNRMDNISPCGTAQKHTGRILPDHAPDEEVDPSQIRFSEDK
ncbi:hypothetical protein GOB93_10915 [Acetobacter musti]|uniref:Uncharacterized protein n=1 Tax=Acetobacter musti TaxID=864732 RepID=A0ABX0JNZ3_9PROT|nr:hypothetical protein [Acetobacter musti]NHN85148.1 hypothetical protein [Acetobacter musti]